MTALRHSNRHVLFAKIILVAAGCAGVLLVSWHFLLPVLGHRIRTGQELGYIGDLVGWLQVKDPTFENIEVLLSQMQAMVWRAVLLFLVCSAVTAAFIAYFPGRIKGFFNERDHPANLAVFRIVVFSVIFFWTFAEHFAFFGSLPASLRFPPPGLDWISSVIPVSPELAEGALWILRISAAAAAIGLFTRVSALLTVILALYVFGIPQLFGKIGHYHHLVWFAAVLCASPCSDALSVDRWRRKRDDPETPLVRHRAYGLPLRICWILFGIIYFFPGFWKYVLSGWEWAFSDNLMYKMYSSWANFGDFEPIFRVDAFPTLLQIGAALVIIFELAFIFCLFFPRIRAYVIAFGFVFHLTAGLFLVVPFWQLHVLYVVFVDWHALYSRVKAKALYKGGATAGFFQPERFVGPSPQASSPGEQPLLMKSVGAVLIAGSVFCGAMYIDSWPFGVYPSHATMSTSTATSMLLSISDGTGNTDEINLFQDNHTFESTFGSVRFRVLTERILAVEDHQRRDELMRTLLDVVAEKYRPIAEAEAVRFYRIRVDVRPDSRGVELDRELLARIEPRTSASVQTKTSGWFR